MDIREEIRKLELTEMRFVSLRRLGILVFTTILLMWYLLTMLGYVIDFFNASVSLIPVSGVGPILILVVPAMVNCLAWTLYYMNSLQEEITRSKFVEYEELPGFKSSFIWGRMVDILALVQILYIWLSMGYIFILAAEIASGGSFR